MSQSGLGRFASEQGACRFAQARGRLAALAGRAPRFRSAQAHLKPQPAPRRSRWSPAPEQSDGRPARRRSLRALLCIQRRLRFLDLR
jgi:hypothetical protein